MIDITIKNGRCFLVILFEQIENKLSTGYRTAGTLNISVNLHLVFNKKTSHSGLWKIKINKKNSKTKSERVRARDK